MKVINYRSIKDKIKKYSFSVDYNLHKAGWIIALEIDAVGRKSIEIIKEYHRNVGNPDDTVYCYRRVPDLSGLPVLLVYVRGG